MSKQKKKAGRTRVLWILAMLAILAAILVTACQHADNKEPTAIPTEEGHIEETTQSVQAEEDLVDEGSINLGYELYMTDIGKYTGIYMEDGMDELVSGVLMLVLKNNGEQDIQYAEITIPVGEETARFTMSTLPVGESVVLLESNRMQYEKEVDYSAIIPKIEHLAYFQGSVNKQEDKLEISIVDGAINVKNISGENISGNITVYYKNAAQDIYYGGITYRITVEGGLKADELRQVMTKHASDTGSKIMFVTIGK